MVIQGLIVCLFLLNYFSFKNMEMESVKKAGISCSLKKTSVQTPFQYGFIYINIFRIMTKLEFNIAKDSTTVKGCLIAEHQKSAGADDVLELKVLKSLS